MAKKIKTKNNTEQEIETWFEKNNYKTLSELVERIEFKNKVIAETRLQDSSGQKVKVNLSDLNQLVLEIMAEKREKLNLNDSYYSFKNLLKDASYRFKLALDYLIRQPYYLIKHWSGLPARAKYLAFSFSLTIFILLAVTLTSLTWSWRTNSQIKSNLVISQSNQTKVVLGAKKINWSQKIILKINQLIKSITN